MRVDLEAIRRAHEESSSPGFVDQHRLHDALECHEHRGQLLAEVERLREGIRQYRVAMGHHMPESWAEHFDELVPPDPVWKALSNQRGLRK